MRLEHPIFRGPLDPGIAFSESRTPDGYRGWPEGADLPEKLRTWVVQESRLGNGVEPGLVSDPYGFADSPDAEWISSGLNSKSPTAVAIGRHGNLFLWGFAGDPDQMTESARRVFINAIVYMKPFAGRRPLVERKQRSRDWAQVQIQSLRGGGAGSLTRERLTRLFPETVLEACGLRIRQAAAGKAIESETFDLEKLAEYYRHNLEYLFPLKGGSIGAFAVDPDLEELGAPNRKPAFFEAIEKRLSADPEDALSLRLLERYVGQSEVKTLAGLRAWLACNRDFLFFSDVGGFRWFVDEHARRERAGSTPSPSPPR